VKAPVGNWTHVAFVYSEGAVRGYVDGHERLATSVGPVWGLFDIMANVLLFVPFGLALAVLGKRWGVPPEKAIPSILALGAALSLGIEVLQCWLPGRVPSLIDVAANGIGCALGAALHFAAHWKIRGR
jgi:VanZ family protein